MTKTLFHHLQKRHGFIEFSVFLTSSELPAEILIIPPLTSQLAKQWWPLTGAQSILLSSRISRLIQARSYGALLTMALSGAGFFTRRSMVLKRLQRVNKQGAGENTEKSILLAPTFALVLYVAEQLPKQLDFCIYLDNFFLNLPVAQCLLAMGIYCMGIMCKKAIGFPQNFKAILRTTSS